MDSKQDSLWLQGTRRYTRSASNQEREAKISSCLQDKKNQDSATDGNPKKKEILGSGQVIRGQNNEVVEYVSEDGISYKVSDSAYIATERSDHPYSISTIQEIKPSKKENAIVLLKWFYRPSEVPDTVYQMLVKDRLDATNEQAEKDTILNMEIRNRELFVADEDDLQMFSVSALRGKCNVQHFSSFQQIKDYNLEPDKFFYVLGYSPTSRRLTSIQGEVKVGSSHQWTASTRGALYKATIPECLPQPPLSTEHVNHDYEELIWEPIVNDCDLVMLLRAARSMAAFAGMCDGGSTDEGCAIASRDETTINAMNVLFQCNGNPRLALQALVKKPLPQTVERKWTEDQVKRFQKGLRQNGKNFYRIRKDHLPGKETSELVEFYYLWKKVQDTMIVLPQNKMRRHATMKRNASSLENGDASSSENDSVETDDSGKDLMESPSCGHCLTTTSEDWDIGGKKGVLLCTSCRLKFKKYGSTTCLDIDLDDRAPSDFGESERRTPLSSLFPDAPDIQPPFMFKPIKEKLKEKQESPSDEDDDEEEGGRESPEPKRTKKRRWKKEKHGGDDVTAVEKRRKTEEVAMEDTRKDSLRLIATPTDTESESTPIMDRDEKDENENNGSGSVPKPSTSPAPIQPSSHSSVKSTSSVGPPARPLVASVTPMCHQPLPLDARGDGFIKGKSGPYHSIPLGGDHENEQSSTKYAASERLNHPMETPSFPHFHPRYPHPRLIFANEAQQLDPQTMSSTGNACVQSNIPDVTPHCGDVTKLSTNKLTADGDAPSNGELSTNHSLPRPEQSEAHPPVASLPNIKTEEKSPPTSPSTPGSSADTKSCQQAIPPSSGHSSPPEVVCMGEDPPPPQPPILPEHHLTVPAGKEWPSRPKTYDDGIPEMDRSKNPIIAFEGQGVKLSSYPGFLCSRTDLVWQPPKFLPKIDPKNRPPHKKMPHPRSGPPVPAKPSFDKDMEPARVKAKSDQHTSTRATEGSSEHVTIKREPTRSYVSSHMKPPNRTPSHGRLSAPINTPNAALDSNKHPPPHSSPFGLLGHTTPAIDHLRQYAIDSHRESVPGIFPPPQPHYPYQPPALTTTPNDRELREREHRERELRDRMLKQGALHNVKLFDGLDPQTAAVAHAMMLQGGVPPSALQSNLLNPQLLEQLRHANPAAVMGLPGVPPIVPGSLPTAFSPMLAANIDVISQQNASETARLAAFDHFRMELLHNHQHSHVHSHLHLHPQNPPPHGAFAPSVPSLNDPLMSHYAALALQHNPGMNAADSVQAAVASMNPAMNPGGIRPQIMPTPGMPLTHPMLATADPSLLFTASQQQIQAAVQENLELQQRALQHQQQQQQQEYLMKFVYGPKQ